MNASQKDTIVSSLETAREAVLTDVSFDLRYANVSGPGLSEYDSAKIASHARKIQQIEEALRAARDLTADE